ncbi:MAG: hypothetical protein AAFY88_02910 [Acidobacteriota bacterium]
MSTTTVNESLASKLDLYADGGLSAEDVEALEQRIAAAPDLAAEVARAQQLHTLIEDSRVPVRTGFTERVMSALPQPHAATARGAWRLPLAMMLVLALGAATLIGTALAENPLVGAGLAVLDFAQTTALAGSGIVVATWRGAGMGLGELIGSSTMNMAAFAIMVLCVNMLFVSLWRRRRPATAESTVHDG